jgi:tetratricopeptide (TPR) repeat protein
MRRCVSPALAVVAATALGLGATSCTTSPGSGQAGQGDPGKGGYPAGRSAPPGASATSKAARVAALIQAGFQQARQEKWRAAASIFTDVLAIDPRNSYALYNLGYIAETGNHPSTALAYYNRALAANGRYTPAMYNKAILLEGSDPRQAIALYKKVIAINPKASAAYLRMAFTDAEQGDTAGARAADRKAIAIDPTLGKYRLPAKKAKK